MPTRSWPVALILLALLGASASLPAADSEEPVEPKYSDEERSHWSFVAPRVPTIPRVNDAILRRQIQTPVDAFVFRKLAEAGLQPAPPAEFRTLLRRLTFDVTGLPPTPAELERQLHSEAPHSSSRLIDRLLASPHYGEHWGQHWLDVVRFAESEGFEYDAPIWGAWRFRDYVIRSFNDDKPFDRFVIEQLAGDELSRDDHELQTAAGFHRLGPVRRNAGNAEVAFSRNEVLTERTNIIGAAFLGLTIGCARCHDHMFDPIRQEDYYQLQAFLAGSYAHNFPLASEADRLSRKNTTQPLLDRITEIKEILGGVVAADRERELRDELARIDGQLPEPLPVIATVIENEEARTAVHLLLRGDPELPLDPVSPRTPGVLLPENTPPWPVDVANRKTLLANWVADDRNPLTARVVVNRIWQYHFGRGLVATPNDFGANGEFPSHPELLDYLATVLVKNDWSIKSLHRLILNSATYQQSSVPVNSDRALRADPENRLWWKYPRRRLTAHELRDAMLSASGQLDVTMEGESVMVPVEQDLIDLLYKPAQWQVAAKAADHHRRSVYLVAKRNLQLPFMQAFDQPDLQTSCPCRESSTHAPQSLELLNGRLSNRLARALAERLLDEAGPSHYSQVSLGFLLTTGRRPDEQEAQLGLRFLEQHPLTEFALALFNLNAFLYVD